MKRQESLTQNTLSDLQRQYESKENIPLNIGFVGDMCEKNMICVVPRLLEMNLPNQDYGYHDVIEIDEGPAILRAHVTRALRPNWFRVNDRAGWVDHEPELRIDNAIAEKAKKLPSYKENTGLDDIRLLIVANRIMNSGKLSLDKLPNLDKRGFRIVYFFPYPEPVVLLP